MTEVIKKLVHQSRPTQTNSYIVIHNTAGGTAEGCYATFCNRRDSGSNICTHYTCDDKKIIKMLEDNWNGQHTTGKGYYKAWSPKKAEGVNNSNSIGIEVADGSMVDMNKANDNCIELIRYLMKAYQIPLSNIVRHGDTQDKDCPHTIMANNKYDYMLNEIKSRNDKNQPIGFDTSLLDKDKVDMTADGTLDGNNGNINGDGGSGGSGGGASVTFQLVFAQDGHTTTQESLPNANTSDNWVDMHKIKGITLHMYPPYQMSCEVDTMNETFKKAGWNRNFHYKVDYKTDINYDTPVPAFSGVGRGGNTAGSSLSDFVLVPGGGVYSGGTINWISGNGGGGGTSGGDGGFVQGGTTQETVWFFLLGKGCSKESAAGVMGNIEVESGFDYKIIQGNGKGPAAGLFQWENYNTKSARWKQLDDYAKSKGKTWDDLQMQLEFFWWEFGEGNEATCKSILNKQYGGIEGFKKSTDIEWATKAFCNSFERPGKPGMDRRISAAKKYYEQFKDQQAPSGGGGGTVNGVYGWPIPGVTTISSKFGAPRDGGKRLHKGIDISCPNGTEIRCYANGTVDKVAYDGDGYGHYVKVKHGEGFYSLYAHCKSISVSQGASVSGGQVVAISNNTGSSTGPHLHYEIWVNNERVDPLKYVKPGGGTVSGSSIITNSEPFSIMSSSSMKDSVFKTMDVRIEFPS